jgi:signal transduction histidine kinase/DNA-binding NarL/FixJ family response regulator
VAGKDQQNDGQGRLSTAASGALAPEVLPGIVGDLPTHRAEVDCSVRNSVVLKMLEQQAALPGILVVRHAGTPDRQVLGLLPRARFLEKLSHKFWPEIYLHKSLEHLGELLRPNPIVVREDCSIAVAAYLAMHRPQESVFEPLTVRRSDGCLELLDIHALMLAQTRLLEQANQEVEKQRAAAENANQAKSHFLANMSHEIRTPLTAILGCGEELLDDRMTDAEREQSVEMIFRNGRHLLELVNDILDLSKIEADRLDVEAQPISPVSIAADVLAALKGRAAQKNIDLRIRSFSAIPEWIQSDPTRLRQILMNLVGNAIKFTESGAVEIVMGLVDEHGEAVTAEQARFMEEGHLKFDVTDTGIGITPNDIERLFQPFTQADGATTRRFGGTGLGLTISRKLSRLLGGDISVSSCPGEGSTFTATILTGRLSDVRMLEELDEAVETVGSVGRPPIVSTTLSARVLLVDDAPDNRLLVSRFLERCHAIVETAVDGREAVTRAMNAWRDRTPFDVILMDMQMPVLDGCGATRELRAAGYDGPIVALTANTLTNDLQRCLDAGCNTYATKPIDRESLIRTIAQLTASDEVRDSESEDHDDSLPMFAAAEERLRQVSRLCNFDVALKRVGGSKSLVREIASMLIELLPGWIVELQDAARNEDTDTLRRMAHTIKNSADNVGAEMVVELAWEFEKTAATEGLSPEPHRVEQLRNLVGRLLEELKTWQVVETAVSA